MRKTGPNDVSDASFEPKVCVFYLFHVLLILSNFFGSSRFYSHCKATGRIRLSCDEENRPKGMYYLFFFAFFLTIFIFFGFFSY